MCITLVVIIEPDSGFPANTFPTHPENSYKFLENKNQAIKNRPVMTYSGRPNNNTITNKGISYRITEWELKQHKKSLIYIIQPHRNTGYYHLQR